MKKKLTNKFLPVICCLTIAFFYCSMSKAQNSMTGDGFGGRLWYKPVSYAIGSYSGYAICGVNKQLYGWGSNTFGQLGNDQLTNTVTPVAAIGMSGIRFFTSGYLSCAILNDNTGWVWGISPDNSPGPKFTSTPQQILTDCKSADASASNAAFVKNDGTVWSVGTNFGQFGNGTLPFPFPQTTIPEQMTGIDNAVRVACGQAFTIILMSDSSVKQVGPGTDRLEATIHVNSNGGLPEDVPVLEHNIIDIKANAYAAYALTSSGQVYSWGFDPGPSSYGLLGNGGTHYEPQLIDFGPAAHSIVAISACSDGEALYALDSSGNVYGVGWGQVMGDGSGLNAYTPVLINSNCKDILCAELFGYVIKNDSTLWATGASKYESSVFMDQPTFYNPEYWHSWIQLNPTGSLMNLCPPTILALKLFSFSATAQQNTVSIQWLTEKAQESESYFVERSTDGILFNTIKVINSSADQTSYKCIDEDPVSGINYYRLRIRGIDGGINYSEVKKVLFTKKRTVKIFPNPAAKLITISIPGLENNTSAIIQIRDISSRMILNQVFTIFNSKKDIDVSQFAEGTYFIKIIIDKKVFNEQVIVIH